MFDPPAGYDDMLGDAELAPFAEHCRSLEVPYVGVVQARRPMPGAIASIALAAHPELAMQERLDYIVQFVQDHLADGEFERISDLMMFDELPADAFKQVARSLATWGTARPYVAVINLSLQTAAIWRTIRYKLVTAGVADPMRLPTMHAVLDVTEMVVLESMVGDTPREGRMKREQFLDRLYAPTPEVREINGEKYVAAPAGFEPDAVEASWEAFAQAAGAG